MSFINELEKSTNQNARTLNGAKSNDSTLNPLLDFFSNAGAMRGKERQAVQLFDAAYAADPTLALRTLFYLRDIRGGQGERTVFRAVLESMSQYDVDKIVKFIPEYGRWDEVPFTTEGINLIRAQLKDDIANLKADKPVSLLAKWLPSGNASSRETVKKAKYLAGELGLVSRSGNLTAYRKTISALRKRIKLLEQTMSQREWAEIQYDKLPSQAHRKHVKAFKRHSKEAYEAYLGKVEKGEAKINSGTAFTYELYDMAMNTSESRTADAMWKALPDWTNGSNALVLPDVSGSMSGRPISVSVSLAVYFAERNKGMFKDYFLEFSSKAKLHKLSGTTLTSKLTSVRRSTNWMGSTDLQSAFDAILEAAVKGGASVDEMPSTLYIISDMQFNMATDNNNATNFEVAQRKFREAGYEMPHVVFWNVNSYGQDAPATMYDNKVTLISGLNQSTFQYVVEGKTPIQSMLDVLNSPRYEQISV